MTRPVQSVGYVLQAFPQLSETFIENERAALGGMGVKVAVYSVFHPPADTVGPTAMARDEIRYLPSGAALWWHAAKWAVRRPGVTAINLRRAVKSRSKTMVRGLLWSGWLASAFRRDGVTHVHAHFATEPACAGLPAARLAGCTFSFTIHARDIYLRNRGLDLRIAAADRVVTVCKYNIDQIVERFPTVDPDGLALVYCGVDPAAFDAPPALDHGGPLRLVTIGRLVAKKGFDDLIEAVAVARDAGVDVTCEIIGRGPLQDDLAARTAVLGLGDRVTLAGALDPPEVAQRLAESDVFVLPCRIDNTGDRDSMPVVIKEAMAAGRPVIASDTVGVPEVVDETVGLLVPPENPAELAAAIQKMAGLSVATRNELGAAGRRRVERDFNLFVETNKLKDLFAELG